jgi:hypothetical protein
MRLGFPSVYNTCIAPCIHATDWFAKTNNISLPFEFNGLELLNTLRCHGTWLSFMIQPVVATLPRSPMPELGVGRVMLWHDTIAKLCFAFKQLFKPVVPTSLACSPVESNTIECSNMLNCHRSCLFFMIQPIPSALLPNPTPQLGFGRIQFRHDAMAKLFLEVIIEPDARVPQSKPITSSARICSAVIEVDFSSWYNL